MRKLKKLKRNKKLLLILIPVILVILIVSTILIVNVKEENELKQIKNSYTKYVKIKNDAKIYDKNKKVIGTIYKDTELELESYKDITKKDKYFKVKDNDYYVYYKDIKKVKSTTKDVLNTNYIVLNKNLKTKNKVTLYKDKNKVLTLSTGINIPIQYSDDNNYYVYFLNKLLSIKKNKKISTINNDNSKEKCTDHISVLIYDKIENTCSDENCIPLLTFKEQVEKLKENGYYTITKDEFSNYLKNNINLKEKAVLLLTNNLNDTITNTIKELNINLEKNENLKLNITNKPSIASSKLEDINAYQIKNYSTVENIILMAQGLEVKETAPVKQKKEVSVPVLNYHFFYDPTLGEECNEGICLTTQKFREHLDYLKNNNFKTLTMDEFTKWIYGEIDIPEKSVLITIDDGAKGTGKHNGHKLIPLLEEYKMHATLFLIAGWWDIENYHSPYLEIQSHTYDMHQYGNCKKGQLVCANYEEAKTDLQKSLDIIKDNTSFCYPFYSYDDEAIQAIKDLGFKVAFAGGNRNATRKSNKYIIPRYPIHSDITLARFKQIVD